ncbi:MAG TPA: hypothetical protein VIB47_10640 [Dehalococcoidia bacterium]
MTSSKRRRRREGFMEGPDKALRLNTLYRPTVFGSDRIAHIAQQAHKDLDDVISQEPDEDLEDSELNDWERQQAIARERTRREGRA